jgi:hypothetical protein
MSSNLHTYFFCGIILGYVHIGAETSRVPRIQGYAESRSGVGV